MIVMTYTKVNVLFFGATAEIVGERRIEFDVEFEHKASEVFKKILAAYPRLVSHKLHFSVNAQYAIGEEIIRDGDELAIFTAVSGG